MNDIKLAEWISIMIIVLSLLLGCSSEKEVCIERFGEVRIINQSEDRQEIYIGIAIVEIGPNDYAIIEDVSVGIYKVVTINLSSGVSTVITDFEVRPCDTSLIAILF